jgi:hypothetical protein
MGASPVVTGESIMRSIIITASAAVTLFSSSAYPQQASEGTTSFPDFSGIWAHPLFPGFEPPASGPGPVTNKSRLDADSLVKLGAPADLARRLDGVSNPQKLVGDYTNPILKPSAAEIVKRQGEIELSGGAPNPYNQCWPQPVPFIFFSYGMQMLQQQHQTTILYSQDHEVRHVRMNQSHPQVVIPSWHGDSVGHYEGDTLVIDTVGVKTERPFAMVDMYGTPYSSALHVVERYRLLDYEVALTEEALKRIMKENILFPLGVISLEFDPNYKGRLLQLQFTVDDEGVFTTPWTATITYGRPQGVWDEHVCAENVHEYYAAKDTPVPHANTPDF